MAGQRRGAPRSGPAVRAGVRLRHAHRPGRRQAELCGSSRKPATTCGRKPPRPRYSPVLRKPKPLYQTAPKFVEQWIASKLMWGKRPACSRSATRAASSSRRSTCSVTAARHAAGARPAAASTTKSDAQQVLAGSLALADTQSDEFIVLPASEIIHGVPDGVPVPSAGRHVADLRVRRRGAAGPPRFRTASAAFFAKGGAGNLMLTDAGGDDAEYQLKQLRAMHRQRAQAVPIAPAGSPDLPRPI